MKEINAAFEKANPDITLKYEFIPSAAYPQRVQSELLAGNTADVIMTDSAKVQDWGSSGYLEDLSSQPWVGGVRKEIKPFVENDGKTYAMPMEVIGISLFANNTLLKKAGIAKPPVTWPEFQADLQKVKDAGITPLSLPNKGGWTGDAAINAIAAIPGLQGQPVVRRGLRSRQGILLIVEVVTAAADGSAVEGIRRLQEVGSASMSGAPASRTSSQVRAPSTCRVRGTSPPFSKAGLDDSFIPWPATSKDDANANLFVGTMLSVNAKSKVKTAAEKYVKFWSESENASLYLQAENAVSPFTDGKSPSGPPPRSSLTR